MNEEPIVISSNIVSSRMQDSLALLILSVIVFTLGLVTVINKANEIQATVIGVCVSGKTVE